MTTINRIIGTSIKKALLGVLASGACALVQADTEQRNVESFTEVAVSSGIDVELALGADFNVQVEADDTTDIVTEVVGDTLRIYRDSGWNWYSFGLISLFMDDAELKATVTLPDLTRVRASGGADIRGEGTFTGDNLELISSGGSNITLDLNYDSIDVESSGGSTMHLSGTTNYAKISSSGGSRQNSDELTIKDADLSSSGGSNLNVGVVEQLRARASGGSNIRYEGDPESPDVRSSGGADITRR